MFFFAHTVSLIIKESPPQRFSARTTYIVLHRNHKKVWKIQCVQASLQISNQSRNDSASRLIWSQMPTYSFSVIYHLSSSVRFTFASVRYLRRLTSLRTLLINNTIKFAEWYTVSLKHLSCSSIAETQQNLYTGRSLLKGWNGVLQYLWSVSALVLKWSFHYGHKILQCNRFALHWGEKTGSGTWSYCCGGCKSICSMNINWSLWMPECKS